MTGLEVAAIVLVTVIVVFAVIMLRGQRRGRLAVRGPGVGASIDVSGGGIDAKGITSRKGGVNLHDGAGGGVKASNITASGDVVVRSEDRRSGSPKA